MIVINEIQFAPLKYYYSHRREYIDPYFDQFS